MERVSIEETQVSGTAFLVYFSKILAVFIKAGQSISSLGLHMGYIL